MKLLFRSTLIIIVALLAGVALTACIQTAAKPKAETKPSAAAQQPLAQTKVIAYYTGDGSDLARYNFNQLTHIIYSFLHLNGNQLAFDNPADQLALQRLVALKHDYPHVKVMLSLGGWGGCETCSDIFNSAENRAAFAQSTLAIIQQYRADGIDLDWEYPTVPGHPGHTYADYDRNNFTALIRELRQQLGTNYELSFAAGGFADYLQRAVDWDAIMPLLDNVNLMSYDIVNGATPHTGHHSALYSTPQQQDSTDYAVQFLLRQGVAPQKIVIGAAFYARVWKDVEPANNGLYQAGTHIEGYGYQDYPKHFSAERGYVYFWDELAQAPSYYSAREKTFATFDDKKSIAAKMAYLQQQQLGGIMFWQLPQDADQSGLLDTIAQQRRNQP